MELQWCEYRETVGKVDFRASVARSLNESSVVEAWKRARASRVQNDECIILRHPTSIVGEPIGYSPKGRPIFRPTSRGAELWKVRRLGAFDSIRFAKAVFDAPENKFFREGVDSLEAIVRTLSCGFSEGEFELIYANAAMLEFALTVPDLEVTNNQRHLLDQLNRRFFIGGTCDKHMKSVHLSSSDHFVIGAP